MNHYQAGLIVGASDLTDYRQSAKVLAHTLSIANPGKAVLVTYRAGNGAPEHQAGDSATMRALYQQAAAAFDAGTASYRYVGLFDPNEAEWPDEWADFGTGILTLPVVASPPRRNQASGNGITGWLIAGGLVAATLFSVNKKGRR